MASEFETDTSATSETEVSHEEISRDTTLNETNCPLDMDILEEKKILSPVEFLQNQDVSEDEFTDYYAAADKDEFISNLKKLSNIDANEPNWFESVKRFIQGYKRDRDHLGFTLKLPICELHSPHLPNCYTVANFSNSKSQEENLTITILGAQFGGGRQFKVRLSDQAESESECLTVIANATIYFQKWTYPNIAAVKDLYTFDRIDIDSRHLKYLKEILGEHYCSNTYDRVLRKVENIKKINPDIFFIDRDFSLLERGKFNFKVEEEDLKNKKYSFAPQFSIPSTTGHETVGLGSLEVSIETIVHREHKLEFRVVPGHKYIVFPRTPDSASLQIYWSEKSI